MVVLQAMATCIESLGNSHANVTPHLNDSHISGKC
jgi:hypothetical protein